jgi:hypothetical protein
MIYEILTNYAYYTIPFCVYYRVPFRSCEVFTKKVQIWEICKSSILFLSTFIDEIIYFIIHFYWWNSIEEKIKYTT